MHESTLSFFIDHSRRISPDQHKYIHRLKQVSNEIEVKEVRCVYLVHHMQEIPDDELTSVCQLLNASLIDHNEFDRLQSYCVVMPKPELSHIWSADLSELLSIGLFKSLIHIDVAWLYVITNLSGDALGLANHQSINVLHNSAWQILLTRLDQANDYQPYTSHSLHIKNAPFEQSEIVVRDVSFEHSKMYDKPTALAMIQAEQIVDHLPDNINVMIQGLQEPISKIEILTVLAYDFIKQLRSIRHTGLGSSHESLSDLFHTDRLTSDLSHGISLVIDSKPGHLALINPRTRHYVDFYTEDNYCVTNLSHHHLLQVCAFLAGERAAVKGTRTITAMNNGAVTRCLAVGLTLVDGNHIDQSHWLDDVISGLCLASNRIGKPIISGYLRRLYKPKMSSRRAGLQNLLHTSDIGTMPKDIYQHGYLHEGLRLIYIGDDIMPTGIGINPWSTTQSESQASKLFPYTNPDSLARLERLIHSCLALGDANPILDVEMVAEGGLAAAVRDICHKSKCGAEVEIRQIPTAGRDMSVHDIWLSESGGRFLIVVESEQIPLLFDYASRERYAVSVIGCLTKHQMIRVHDENIGQDILNIQIDRLDESPTGQAFEHSNTPKFICGHSRPTQAVFKKLVKKILHLPSLSDKTELMVIQDRYVSGLVTRDPFVGPYQVPVADVGVVQTHVLDQTGEAIAFGERPAVAWTNVKHSLWLSVSESLTNIAAAFCGDLSHVSLNVSLSVRRDDPAGYDDAHSALKELVDLCSQDNRLKLSLGSADWLESGTINPVNFVATATSRVLDVKKTLSPVCQVTDGYELLAIDLSEGGDGLAGSAYAEVMREYQNKSATADLPLVLDFFNLIQSLNRDNHLVAYHDRSDGGFFITLLEMAFASGSGIHIMADGFGSDPLEELLTEGPGAIIQIRKSDFMLVMDQFEQAGFTNKIWPVGSLADTNQVKMSYRNKTIYHAEMPTLHEHWSFFSHRVQKCHGKEEVSSDLMSGIVYNDLLRLSEKVLFEYSRNLCHEITADSPKVAILREQGSTGYMPLAMACRQAGFMVSDITTRDIEYGHETLAMFDGLVVASGASFGDSPKPGLAWAEVIRRKHPHVFDEFKRFFSRTDAFTLAVGSGCHLLYHLRDIIPGTDHWQPWQQNSSLQFECRYVNVVIESSSSILFEGMAGSQLVVSVANGFGRCDSNSSGLVNRDVVMKYVNNHGDVVESYPANPFGSDQGICGYTSNSGLVTSLMAHPERCVFSTQETWRVDMSSDLCSPWIKVFENARQWVLARHKERPPLS